MTARPSVVPGLAVLAALAALAAGVATVVPRVSELILAIIAGAVVANTVGVPAWAQSGVRRYKLVLESAIVLLGARVAVDQLATVGPTVFGLVVFVIAFGVVFVELLSRYVFDLARTNGSLLAAGSSVCGVSAVAAVASSIQANEQQLAYAAATVLLFDALTLVLFPVFGQVLDISAKAFGVWAGLSMFSTGPVAAVGFANSPVAGEWATITKLVRNSFIGVLAIGYAFVYLRWYSTPNAGRDADGSALGLGAAWNAFPKFLVGFVFVVAIANAGLLSDESLSSIATVTDWLFLVAFAGLGFDVRLSSIRDAGARPVLVVLLYLLVVSFLSLIAVTTLL